MKRIEHVDGKKRCYKCKIYKPLECFGKHKRAWDGLQDQCKVCRKEYSKKWREKNSEYSKKWYEKNSEKMKENNKKWYEKPALFKTYEHKLVVDDKPKKAPDGIHLLVVCKTCYKHFEPTNLQTNNRIKCLNGKIKGEGNFYCSDTCKNTCSIFHKISHRTGENHNLDREIQPELRKMCLERDNYTCQKCSSTENLHCHHITGILQNPIESADVGNTITLCQKCHLFVHHLPGCSYHDMQCLHYTI